MDNNKDKIRKLKSKLESLKRLLADFCMHF